MPPCPTTPRPRRSPGSLPEPAAYARSFPSCGPSSAWTAGNALTASGVSGLTGVAFPYAEFAEQAESQAKELGMSAEIVQFVGQAGPYLTAALGAYGAGVLTRAENAAVEATANVGRRMLQSVWRRRDEQGRAELEAAVQDAAEATDDEDAAAAMRQQLKRAVREDAELLRELTALLPSAGGPVTVTASGERSIAAQTIGIAVTGDNATLRP